MKKSSQLRKIAVVLSIFESNLFLFSVTGVKAQQYMKKAILKIIVCLVKSAFHMKRQ